MKQTTRINVAEGFMLTCLVVFVLMLCTACGPMPVWMQQNIARRNAFINECHAMQAKCSGAASWSDQQCVNFQTITRGKSCYSL